MRGKMKGTAVLALNGFGWFWVARRFTAAIIGCFPAPASELAEKRTIRIRASLQRCRKCRRISAGFSR
jgi:hypothetical protein